jgi:hypothetical protein
MSDSLKRPWFKFHLLTLVLITICLGAFLGANVQKRRRAGNIECGWPLIACEWYMDLEKFYPEGRPSFYSGPPVYNARQWYARGLAFDATVALTTVICLALISESLIRRREGRKP